MRREAPLWAATGFRALPVPLKRQAIEADLRRASRDHVRHDAARAGRHGPAQRAVSGGKIEVAVARRPDDRRAVRCHRPEAGPELGLRYVAAARKEIRDHVIERVAAALPELQAVARDLGRAADADA